MIQKQNIEIREAAQSAKIPLWKVAEFAGRSESYFCRMLRYELPEDEKSMILRKIKAYAGGEQ